jgi:hypothetical protein
MRLFPVVNDVEEESASAYGEPIAEQHKTRNVN